MARQTAPKRRRRERGSIDPDDIVAGAFELADEVSIDNLSMPMLGKHLGVGVTSIYWYFRKKDDLLNAMTDRALREYLLAVPLPKSEDWRESLTQYAHTMRKAFLSNPILVDLILIRATLGPRYSELGAKHIEGLVARLVDAGLTFDDGFDTFSALQLHLHGSIVLTRLHEKSKASDPDARTYYEDLAISPESTPILAQAAAHGHTGGAPDDRNFEFGLRCILDHAERLIESRNAEATPRGAA
ncbi:TetR/AcrR family transcriptional regulator [Gordonia hankookensis]|uniref:TetR/AcrR family transcriptional regulator n=1 Tax=Gordonia hankookensis TaxID=589403 RepID=A0ABR7WAT0_9ACTN|nr:TetR/AcrR family transcriptional regulator C-terminal domain-containing protein [Gordonia hankookensis]MBD1319363.1 TetR/AcrR family transcriptional regulator [Gordonia hankookensis]NDZ97452.1 TetR/AcrR family transcriptional regulator [Streptomyces sp. SID11726]NEB27077.1 TetR/AcrR family transcriptional regulator [Streptomyces sp. SID6673]